MFKQFKTHIGNRRLIFQDSDTVCYVLKGGHILTATLHPCCSVEKVVLLRRAAVLKDAGLSFLPAVGCIGACGVVAGLLRRGVKRSGPFRDIVQFFWDAYLCAFSCIPFSLVLITG